MVAIRNVRRVNVRKSRLVFFLVGCFTFWGADNDRVDPEEGREVDVGRIEFLDIELLA